MNIFKQGNWSHGSKCKICGSSKKGKVVLVPIVGTENDGNIRCEQFHLDCINLRLQRIEDGTNFLFQNLGDI